MKPSAMMVMLLAVAMTAGCRNQRRPDPYATDPAVGLRAPEPTSPKPTVMPASADPATTPSSLPEYTGTLPPIAPSASARAETAGSSVSAPPATPPAPGRDQTYVVRKGDTLYAISKRFYGAGRYWTAIDEANRGKYQNPNAIPVSTVLVIPTR